MSKISLKSKHQNTVKMWDFVKKRAASAQTPATSAQGVEKKLDSVGEFAARKEIQNTVRATVKKLHPENALMFEEMMNDLMNGMALLREMPPAVTFLGSARVRPGDETYEQTADLAQELARALVPVRTGAGPGVMGAAPEGFLRGHPLAENDPIVPQALVPGTVDTRADTDDLRTQGFNIVLPYEQAVDENIQNHLAIKHFPFRKLMLFENTRALLTMPGGFGTLDELFEIWVMDHKDPMLAVGEKFWTPIFEAIDKVARKDRTLIDDKTWGLVEINDDPAAVVALSANTQNVSGFEEDPDILSARFVNELACVYEKLEHARDGVTVLGGNALSENDPLLSLVGEISTSLFQGDKGVRVGGSQVVADAVQAALMNVKPKATPDRITAFPLESEGLEAPWADSLPVTDVLTQKHALTRGSSGVVAFPGGIETIGQVFSFLCEVQCGKVPKIPIVLVGTEFWTPIMDAIKTAMLDGERQLISPEDMELFVITDDPKVIESKLQEEIKVPVPTLSNIDNKPTISWVDAQSR